MNTILLYTHVYIISYIIYVSHSFSYDCRRYFNLCVIEPNVIVFASGNILHFLNTTTNVLWFRRGSTGGGIGHITVPTFIIIVDAPVNYDHTISDIF